MTGDFWYDVKTIVGGILIMVIALSFAIPKFIEAVLLYREYKETEGKRK